MRPLRLKVKAFTAFRDEQEVDFSKLDLFAIAGPTGAGKSSVLDAITYALYGWVERVGDSCAQLISQGLPSMAVTLEFGLDGERYVVTRRTTRPIGKRPAHTEVLLQRIVDGEPVSETGQVRETNARIAALVGLDYDGFTRAVLLPQGRFDEFLKGQAKERRKILTDLLGLALYDQMGERARAFEREARAKREGLERVLDAEYAEVTEAALRAERARASSQRERERALATTNEVVRKVVRRRDEARRAAEDLRACADEAAGHAGSATASAAGFRDLGRQLAEAEKALGTATERAKEAAGASKRSRALYASAVERWGASAALKTLHTQAVQLAEQRGELVAVERSIANDVAEVPTRKEALAVAVKDQEAARTAEARAKAAFELARDEHERAQHGAALAVVVRGVKRGGPCPVCKKPLAAVPKIPAAELERARARLERAGGSYETAREAARDASDGVKEARRELAEIDGRIGERRIDAKARGDRITKAETSLRTVLGARLPADPAATLRERMDEIEALEKAAAGAERSVLRLENARAESERTKDRLTSRVETEVAGLPLAALGGLRRRAVTLVPDAKLPEFRTKPPKDGPLGLQRFSAELAAAFEALRATVSAEADARAGTEAGYLRETTKAVGDLQPVARTLDELATFVESALRAAADEAVRGEARAEDIKTRLARKSGLLEQAKRHGARADLMHALALDLKADAITDFLQAEALRALAAEGSKRLAYLSSGRYRLRYRDDEFYVQDVWNGDEERSVKTLSGGETFLAALALALTLSEQVRALATTRRARLDSLFLDEGFGTLDSETLEAVIDGVERLGADGRLVGIISHVRELTDRFTRIDVEKSQRGSQLKTVA